ncbi:hypothetical protein PTKIN_Ptkin10aG0193500 [Pterospermum kingtungense]
MGQRRKNMTKKEEIAEDYCFFCKDGGSLIICEYKNCLKSYHPQCVGSDDSLLETEQRWVCGWHSCFICGKAAKFHCFCCPSAVCGRCLCDAEFALVKGKKGFCNSCSELALLIEDKKDVNSNGVKVDFNDRGTYEFLFKGYWELVKEKEGLTSKDVHSSDRLLKDGKNCDFQANNNYGEEDASDFEDDNVVSDYDDLSDNQVQCRKRKKEKPSLTKRKGKSKKREFLGWASKQLTEFLMSIGKNVMQELSQYDVATIVTEYCREHNLFHPQKKKKVICDERLQSLLGRKSVNRNGINKLLTVHFAENLEQSEDSVGLSSNEADDVLLPCKRLRKLSPNPKVEEKEIVLNHQQGSLAAIVSRNIKLVYLKRSLVQKLAKQLDTFYGKMIGSFVRVKSDPNDFFRKNSYMLVQVKGIKRTSIKEEMNSIILLQVSNMVKDIPVCELSDDDFTEEEIEDLNWRMRTRRLERPTAVDLELKARSLHEDITKHTPVEQSRLINEIPEVVVDVAESRPVSEDSPREDKQEEHKGSTKAALRSVSGIQTTISEKNGVPCSQNAGMEAAGPNDKTFGVPIPEGKRQDMEASVNVDHCHHSTFTATRAEGDETERNQRFEEVKQSSPATSAPQLLPQQCQTKSVHQEKQYGDAAGEKLHHLVDTGEQVKVENRVQVIELSDDEMQDAGQQTVEDLDSDIWYIISRLGIKKGPYCMNVLKKWFETSCGQSQVRVFKSGQKPEDAVLLTDSIKKIFNSM